MKKNLKFIFTGLVMLSAIATFAQDDNAEAKKNIIKVNVSSLVFSNVSLQYERILSRKTSVALGVGFRPKSKLPFAGTLKDRFGSNSDAAKAIDDTKMGNFNITPEFRYYVGRKGAPRGFYIAPFARYNNLKLDQMYRFTTLDNVNHVANISGNINSFGGGILFGTQWNLSKKLTLDWWILGPSIGKSKGTLVGTDPINIQPQDRAEIEKDIEGVNLPGIKVDAIVEQNKITANFNGQSYGVRTFGFVLGFNFN